MKVLFCYRYGVIGGVSTQLLNRYTHFSAEFDIGVLYESDHGMVGHFPPGVARVAATDEAREAAIREAEPDVLVVIDSPSFLSAWQRAGSPGSLILEVHTTTTNLSYVSELAVRPDHIVTVSEYMRGKLSALGLSPISVVPNCLDERWYAETVPPALESSPVAWIGKLDGHKRWRAAADLLDRIATERPGVTPLMVGGYTAPASEVAALTTKLTGSPALGSARWLPRVDYELMPALYSAIGANGGLTVSTTTDESFGMSVAEALVRGCPVIAPAVGALPEILPEEALYAPGDSAAAAAKALQALSDPAFRASLLSTAQLVRERTHPEYALAAFANVLQRSAKSSMVA
ncbi:glycosyl transferase family 4 [Nonomuraea polychroma]|uniref:Glycosyl transferase family 4 n=1 Tax=Nonomuraea polychroma TaxID=46176 RepID=A0A438LZN7_9ACTN|nr:glycosyltransferase family 4 protein [Nonomuraea polychroma]RVX38861.1 glycosyl transferase family 4 [Nonomuraea polychroma]